MCLESTTTRAYSLFSAEAYTTPEPTLFFFRRRLLLVRFVCSAPPPGKVSPRKSRSFSRHGDVATRSRPGQVPPERHMRIVFTCCSLSRSPNFVAICNPAEPAWKGGKAAKLVDETPFSTRSPHTTRTFVSIAPIRNFLPSLIFLLHLYENCGPRRKSVLELHSPNFRPFEVAFERQTTQTDGRHLKPSDRS